MRPRKRLLALASGVLVASVAAAATAIASTRVPVVELPEESRPGNVVFLHADGAGLSHWSAARAFWAGPDGALAWDRTSGMGVYRGHMADVLVGTSNGGATTHAFGYKVEGRGSFGKDGDGTIAQPSDRYIEALSGYPGSILREAANAPRRHPVGLVNDGNIGEPGTGAFAAEVGSRGEWNAIVLQILAGRGEQANQPVGSPGPDRPPVVVLGGGERNMLPANTPMCAPEQAGTFRQPGGIATYPLDCMVHDLDWSKPGRVATPDRGDGRNLLQEAAAAGYTVIRTRAEFEAVAARLQADRTYRPKILGAFAAHHTYNDVPEEVLIANGFQDPSVDPNVKETNLILWGSNVAGDASANPPRHDEMHRMAHRVLTRFGNEWRRPYLLVSEPESVDNFGNNNNAIGTLQALKRTDDSIAVTLQAAAGERDNDEHDRERDNDERDRERDSDERRAEGLDRSRFPTSIIVAADGDAGGMQLAGMFPVTDPATRRPIVTDGQFRWPARVGNVNVNPTGVAAQEVRGPLDGRYGRASAPFLSEPDQFGKNLAFGIAWAGTPDFMGGVLARAGGFRASDLNAFSERFDNTDIYRFLYLRLFGEGLDPTVGERAPDRED